MHRRLLAIFGVVLLVASVAAAAGAVSASGKSSARAHSRRTGPVVYETKLPCCQTKLIGPQSHATLILKSPALPVGTYLVQATVGVVMGPNDNVVCATSPVSVGGNDGIFGGAGNGATESGRGPNGVYGDAVIVDTWKITRAGDKIQLSCNVGHFGAGTYASQGLITAERLGALHG